MKDLRQVDPNDRMRRISKINGGYWVRFTHCNKTFCQNSFYATKYGSIERALTKAQIWRNSQERRFIKNCTFDRHWSDSKNYYIAGLGWYQNFIDGRFVDELVSYYKHADIYPRRTFSITKYGLRDAFDLAIEDLRVKRQIDSYPIGVVNKAYRLLNKEYQLLSIA